MKCIATLAMIDASPLLAERSRSGSLIGAIVAPVAAIVPVRNLSASNNVSVAGMSAVVPTALKNDNILFGIGGGSRGCGCN